ncbi:hypothetical protein AB1484_11570 [Parafrankia sp. FMc6]|uniref:hypothetical protein n=1 Tax=Parafrankia soli TaxID=2599596 RepID=UPI0034D4D423
MTGEMQVTVASSWSAKAHNEDACGFRADGAWVVDGATALEAGPPIEGLPAAAWLSSVADDYLCSVDWDGAELADVLARLVGHVAARARLAGLPYAGTCRSTGFPTAAISVVRQRGDLLDLCLLGDVPVVLAPAGGRPSPTVFVDPQFTTTERTILDAIRADIDHGDDPAAAYGRARGTLLERRRRRNTSRGSWILGDVPEATRHAHCRTLRLTGGEDLLLLSDGFARLVEPFALVDGYGALVDAVRRGAAEELVHRLRETEQADPECRRHPRFGVSDDASVVHAVI